MNTGSVLDIKSSNFFNYDMSVHIANCRGRNLIPSTHGVYKFPRGCSLDHEQITLRERRVLSDTNNYVIGSQTSFAVYMTLNS
jgi:hypothetical protein